MSGIKQIQFKNKDLFIIDNTGLIEDEIIQNTKAAEQIIFDSKKRDHLLAIDMNVKAVSPNLNKQMKELGKKIIPYTKKCAIVGMASGIKKVIISGFLKLVKGDIKLCNSLEEAKNWLVI